MRPRLFYINIAGYLLTLAIHIALLLFFFRPVDEVARLAQFSPAIQLLSGQKTGSFAETRSFERLKFEFDSLSKAPVSCLSPIDPFWTNHLKSPDGLTPKNVADGVSLRDMWWHLKSSALKPDDCIITPETAREIRQSEAPERLHAEKVTEQRSKLQNLLRNGYFLLEAEVRVTDDTPRPLFLALNSIRGTSAIFWDSNPIAYFQEQADSIAPIRVDTTKAGSHRLSILIYGRGFDKPGVNSSYFAGFLDVNSLSRPDTNYNSNLSEPTLAILQILLTIISSVFLVFAIFDIDQRRILTPFSTLFVASALAESLTLLHVQATLSDAAIRTIRLYAFGVFTAFSLWLVRELVVSFLPVFDYLIPGFQSWRKRMRSSWLSGPSLHAALIFGGVASGYAVFFFVQQRNPAPLPVVEQYRLFNMTMSFLLFTGFSLLALSLYLTVMRIHAREREEVLQLSNTITRGSLIGSTFLAYSFSHGGILTSMLKSAYTQAGTLQLVQTLSVPVLAAITVLTLMILAFRKKSIYRQVLPETVEEMIRTMRHGESAGDQTSTEFNWTLINDIVGSSTLKVTTLETLSHTLQSAFHKIHKDYLRGAMRFVNSIGDALLITIKTPAHPRNGDPVLEKLVRCYVLHHDGVKLFRRAERVNSALLALQTEELALAIRKQCERRISVGFSPDQIGFRTLLTANYYFYGINSSISNIDAKHIFLVAKSEKKLDTGKKGGLFIFPDLMAVITFSFPELETFFEPIHIETQELARAVAQVAPTHAFRLRDEMIDGFEATLRRLYGGPLFLRSDELGEGSYSQMSSEAQELIQKITQAATLEALVETLSKKLPRLRSFLEKDELIIACADRALTLGFWNESAGHDRLREQLRHIIHRRIGVPIESLLRELSEKDERLEPATLLRDLRSWDPNTRNRAMEFLPLARVQNEFRPHAPDRLAFTIQVLEDYLPRIERYSAESHLRFWLQIRQTPDTLRAIHAWVSESPQRAAQIHALHKYLADQEAECLRSTARWIDQNFNIPGRGHNAPKAA